MSQRSAFFLAVGANVFAALLSGTFLIRHLASAAAWQGDMVGVCVAAVVLWAVVTLDARLKTQQATLDSYLLEQLADTKLKQFVTEKVCSGELEMRAAAETVRRHH